MNKYIVLIHDNEWQTVSKRVVDAGTAKSALRRVLTLSEYEVDGIDEILNSLESGKISARRPDTWLTVDLDDTRTFFVIRV